MISSLSRHLRVAIVASLCAGFARAGIEELPEALLGYQLPDVDWSAILDDRIKAGLALPELPPEDTGPPETASPAELLAYWREDWPWREKREPSPAIREKILEAVKAKPLAIPDALPGLPLSEEAVKVVLALTPRLPATTEEDLKDLRKVRAWLFRHGGMLREELVADARLARWESYLSNEGSDDTLEALKVGEPALARKIFGDLAKGDNRGLAVVATRLLAEMSEPEEAQAWRDQLVAAAANPGFPEKARQIAVESLSSGEWPGKDDWFVGAMKEENPGDVSWFSRLVYDAPDRWIGPLVAMVGGENRHAHNHAVCLLVRLSDRPEAIRPLLPWLKDPDWAKGFYSTRLNLVQSLEEVELPECVPGLRHLVLHDSEESCVSYACKALLHYQAKEAVPDMKAAIPRPDLKRSRHAMAEAIYGLGGFSTEEVAAYIEVFFTEIPAPEDGRGFSYGALGEMTPAASVGSYLAKSASGDPVLSDILLKRAAVLEEEHPEAARALLNFVAVSPAPAGLKALASLLEGGQLAEEPLIKALERRRDNAATWDGTEFKLLTARGGVAGGLAAVLSGDRKAMDKALAAGEFSKQIAVIAAARITEDPLDIDRLAEIYQRGDADDDDEKEPTDEGQELGDAAWSYLRDREDPKAASFVKNHRADPLDHVFGVEEVLRKRKLPYRGASEIFTLAEMSNGATRSCWYLIVHADQVLAVRSSRSGRVGTCTITPEKIEGLRNYVATYRADELPPLKWDMQDGVSYDYRHATRDGERSVFMSNPPTSRQGVLYMMEGDDNKFSKGVVLYCNLLRHFEELFGSLTLDYGYGPGIEILSTREEAIARTVWKRDTDIRVLIDETSQWRTFSSPHGRLLEEAGRPPGFLFPASHDERYPGMEIAELRRPWLHRSGEGMIRNGKHHDKNGLWRYSLGKDPELVSEGKFAGEVVSSDGRWCVAVKIATGEPDTMVRINLETKEVLPLALEAADHFSVITFENSHGKFLIEGRRDSDGKAGPENPEFHLMDPASGKLEEVRGEFDPLRDEDLRPLQAGNEPFMVWAADVREMSGSETSRTVVGKYDTKAFKFTPVKEIEGISFRSSSMWVDEAEGMIYAAAGGDLVKIPMEAK